MSQIFAEQPGSPNRISAPGKAFPKNDVGGKFVPTGHPSHRSLAALLPLLQDPQPGCGSLATITVHGEFSWVIEMGKMHKSAAVMGAAFLIQAFGGSGGDASLNRAAPAGALSLKLTDAAVKAD